MLSFEKDIKPMITPEDREQMLFAFDLWDYEDVRRDIPRIAMRIRECPTPATGEAERRRSRSLSRGIL